MSQKLLSIKNLHAVLETGKELLCGLDLEINKGETHVIMGPNGAGKSTLANVIMAHPDYIVSSGSIEFEGEDLLDLRTDERARKGIFMSFQTPEEVDGVTVADFLKSSMSAIEGKPVRFSPFMDKLKKSMDLLLFDHSYARRCLNVGFSGGEKKKNEILQLLMLNPKLAILDETDSGLDVDAVKTVTDGVRQYKSPDNALLIISHSTKLLDNIGVDYVHILVDGKIVFTGGKNVIDEVNNNGFSKFTPVLG